MKRNIVKVLIVALSSFSVLSCSALTVNSKNEKSANQPAPIETKNETLENSKPETIPQKREILWDFRVNDFAEPPNISKAETKVVWQYLFGNQADSSEVQITSRVSGSFTKPNAKETLYYITGCKENGDSGEFTTDCPHAFWNSDGWIAIYDGQTPVMKLNEPLGYGVAKVTDLNGDGISELFTMVGVAYSGTSETSASLGYFKNGKYIVIKSFDGSKDNCAYGSGEMSVEAAVISYIPTTNGRTPVFTTEYFQNKCKEPPVWKKITKKQFGVE